MRFATLAAAVLTLAPATTRVAGETLRWKWSPGDEARYHMTMSMDMTMNGGPMGAIKSTTNQQMLQRWSAQPADTTGQTKLVQSTERVVMSMRGPMGQGLDYDSASETAPLGMAAMVAPMFDALVESSITMTVNELGEVLGVDIPDELRAAFDNMQGGAISADSVAKMSEQGMMRFPQEPIEVGSSWTNSTEVAAPQMGAMRIDTTYTYNGLREVDGRALAAFTPSVAMSVADPAAQAMPVTFETRESGGEVLFDPGAGRIVSSRIEQVTDVIVVVGERQIRNEIRQVTEFRSLENGETPDMGVEAAVADESLSAEPAGAGS